MLRRRVIEARAIIATGFFALGLAAASVWVRSIDFAAVLRAIAQMKQSYLPALTYADPSFVAAARALMSNALGVAAATLTLWAALFGWMRAQPAVALALPWLASAELFWFALMSTTSFDASAVLDPRWSDVLAQHPGDYRVFDQGHHDRAMAMHTYDAWGYDPGVSRRYAELVASTQGIAPEDVTQYVNIREPSPLLALVRLRFVRRDDAIIELPTPPMPRFSLIDGHRVVSDSRERLAVLRAPSFDPRQLVLLEQEPHPAPGPGRRGVIRVLHDDDDAVELAVDTDTPRLLLATDAYADGWHAEALPGSAQRDYELLIADHALRAVPLRAGEHHLRIVYRPSSLRFGIWIAALAWLAYSCAWIKIAASNKGTM